MSSSQGQTERVRRWRLYRFWNAAWRVYEPDDAPQADEEQVEVVELFPIEKLGWEAWANLTAADSFTSLIAARYRGTVPADLLAEAEQISRDCRAFADKLKALLTSLEQDS